jgi:hypothetical protein
VVAGQDPKSQVPLRLSPYGTVFACATDTIPAAIPNAIAWQSLYIVRFLTQSTWRIE